MAQCVRREYETATPHVGQNSRRGEAFQGTAHARTREAKTLICLSSQVVDAPGLGSRALMSADIRLAGRCQSIRLSSLPIFGA